ncbi:MAG: acyltransferase [Caldilinea sp.]|jgi:acetyltransferase-like isoleucine patch superfamily enzyme|nr:acyltransferase [Caldilinea sp.]
MKRLFQKLVSPITSILLWLLPSTRISFIIKENFLRLSGIAAGRNIQIWQGVRISPLRNISFGSNVAVGYDVLLRPEGGLNIGNRVLIGHGSKIITANHVIPNDRRSVFGAGHIREQVTIKDDVWIAANTVILPGVTLGEGCVVAAGAVVTDDVPPYAIVGGVPARLIRIRD